ncbi:hypothetical protein [Streptomyces luteireticuli]|uniref:hypothetical protein n=1 Tax=Streptomyces luteireticuli TaxID=173858 RepID=UPI003556DFD1
MHSLRTALGLGVKLDKDARNEFLDRVLPPTTTECCTPAEEPEGPEDKMSTQRDHKQVLVESGWAPATVRVEHLRALTTLSERSVLVADRTGRITVVTPDAAWKGYFAGEMRLLAHREDLLDAGLRESWKTGRLTGPVVEVCTAEAASLNVREQEVAV